MGYVLIPFLILWPAAAAFSAFLIGRNNERARDIFVMSATALEFFCTLGLAFTGYGSSLLIPGICGLGVSFRADGFRLLFASVTSYMWMMTTCFSADYLAHSHGKNRYYMFLMITLSAVMGVFLSDDLFTTFIFFEIMSMASYVCVVHEEDGKAMNAGGVYLAVAVIGGMVTLMGLFLLNALTGTLSFEALYPAVRALWPANRHLFYLTGALIIFGFGAKAGMYPLHVWLPMAHPVAPAPASALLSGIITKTGIFGVLVVSTEVFLHDEYFGMAVLIFGVVTMLLGGILAVFSMDLKRTLACSSMSQLGFIFVGIGMQGLLGEDNALAVRGTVLHMFNHSNLKLVLFMAAGVVVMNLHKLDLNDIRGFGRRKPLLKYAFLMGSLGIGGIPLWNGYISKTLIHEAIVEFTELLKEGHISGAVSMIAGGSGVLFMKTVEWLFILTGAMTVAYMTKLFAVLFIEKNKDPEIQAGFDSLKNYMKPLTGIVLFISASVLPLMGCFPYVTLDALADISQSFMKGEAPAHAVHYFSLANLKGGFYSIVLGALIYIFVIRRWMIVRSQGGHEVYVDRWPKKLDLLKLLYEPLFMRILPEAAGACSRMAEETVNTLWRILPEAAGACSRMAENILDSCIYILKKTLYQPIRIFKIADESCLFSFIVGSVLDAGARLLNITLYRRHPISSDYVEVLTRKERALRQTNKIISASAEFSLMMFGIGLVITVLYLFLS